MKGRFERTVVAKVKQLNTDKTSVGFRCAGCLETPEIIKLLRAEHRAVVRMVKALRHKGKIRTEYQSNRETKCAVISAYTLACDDILHKLSARGK